MASHQTLPDYIKPGLDILFIGINPGVRSAEVGHHYAGHSNRFWKLLNEAELVPSIVTYHDDWRLPEWGVGLTNIVSKTTPGSGGLIKSDYVAGRAALVGKIQQYRPRILALLGITLYPILFAHGSLHDNHPGEKSRKVKIGLLSNSFEGAKVMLLPNPSGRNAHYSYQDMLKGYRELHRIRKSLDDP